MHANIITVYNAKGETYKSVRSRGEVILLRIGLAKVCHTDICTYMCMHILYIKVDRTY